MFVGREGGCKPCVFHLRQVFECLPRNRWGVGVVEAANPEFQVVRKKKGGTEKKEGRQSRGHKRCSVFSGKGARDEGRRAEGSLFGLRSGGLI